MHASLANTDSPGFWNWILVDDSVNSAEGRFQETPMAVARAPRVVLLARTTVSTLTPDCPSKIASVSLVTGVLVPEDGMVIPVLELISEETALRNRKPTSSVVETERVKDGKMTPRLLVVTSVLVRTVTVTLPCSPSEYVTSCAPATVMGYCTKRVLLLLSVCVNVTVLPPVTTKVPGSPAMLALGMASVARPPNPGEKST